jgi:hypothetical protein
MAVRGLAELRRKAEDQLKTGISAHVVVALAG